MEKEVGVPDDALPLSMTGTTLSVSTGASIGLAAETSIRNKNEKEDQEDKSVPRCLVVGRQAASADIRIQHKSISRKHAVFYRSADQHWMLKDLGGKHGTHVNGNRLPSESPTQLHQGDTIIFGNAKETVFTFTLPHVVGEETMPVSGKDAAEAVIQKGDPESTKEKESSAGIEPQSQKEQDGVEASEARTRQDREAQIAAMVASLDENPAYTRYEAPAVPDTVPSLEQPQPKEKRKLRAAAEKHKLPILEQFHIPAYDKRKQSATTLAVDRSGARFVVGSGSVLKLYNFSGMDRERLTPFKMIQVEEGYNIVDACYSNTGDRIFVATGSVQPKILDRDGEEIVQFVRGDMYVRDMSRTSGHTGSPTAVDWNPLERDRVLSSSRDGSARVWNLNGKTQFDKLVCDKVFSAKNSKGQRTNVTAVTYHPGGREFVLGTSCGSLQVWNATKVTVRPERAVFDAHGEGKAIQSLRFNGDGTQLASRADDGGTVQVWGYRKISRSGRPVTSCPGVPNADERPTVSFSPDGKMLVAGSFVVRKAEDGKIKESGKVKIFKLSDAAESKMVAQIKAPVGVIHVVWHPKLNQILAGCSDGSVLVLFDHTLSRNGAVVTASKAVRRTDDLAELLNSRAPTGSAGIRGQIVAPHEQVIGDYSSKRKHRGQDEETDPSKKRRPELPATGFKTGSQSSATVTFTQFVSNSSLSQNKPIAGKDPREALFKYQKGKNYTRETEADRILASQTAEEEEAAMREKKDPNK